jgi:transcriptional regulator with XRE-family HTH domain
MRKTPHPLIVKLEEVRLARGLSGNKMAQKLGIAASTWTRMVKDGMQPNIDLIPAAAREFPEVRFFVVERLLISTNTCADEPVEAAG